MAEERTILLVDDEEYVRTAVRRSLRREPYVIEEAADPLQALAILEQRPFDLLLADHLMPGMTGLELLSIARARWPETIRIILTGHADTSMAIAAINQGEIYRFLTKPWDDLELKVTLFNAFERLDRQREAERLLARSRERAGLPGETVSEEEIRAALGWTRER